MSKSKPPINLVILNDLAGQFMQSGPRSIKCMNILIEKSGDLVKISWLRATKKKKNNGKSVVVREAFHGQNIGQRPPLNFGEDMESVIAILETKFTKSEKTKQEIANRMASGRKVPQEEAA